MSDGLAISPTELKFRFELRKNIPVILSLTNPTGERIAFKVKTTSPKTYCVRPSSGFVDAGASLQVHIIRQAQREYPPAWGDTKDKFLVQSTRVSHNLTEITPDMFDSASNSSLQQAKLRVTLVGPPQPPSPVPEHPENEHDVAIGGAATAATASARGGSTFGDQQGLTQRGVGQLGSGLANEGLLASYKEKLDRADKENAELRRKLVARNAPGSGLSVLHLILVAIVSMLVGYLVK